MDALLKTYKISKNFDENKLNSIFTRYNVLINDVFKKIKFEHWLEIINAYKLHLRQIIEDSPSIHQTMTVFRGVKDTFFENMTKNNIYKNAGFVSTSINYDIAAKPAFSNLHVNKCCIFKIKLLKGSKALFISGLSKYQNPSESEFLLSDKTNFVVQSYKEEVYEPRKDPKTMCVPDAKKVLMMGLVAI